MKSNLIPTLSRISAWMALMVTVTEIEASEPSVKKVPRIDPAAMSHLQRMSSSLAAAKTLSYQSASTMEVPTSSGQFITLFSSAKIAVKRPDKLRVELTGECPNFNFYYDGITANAYAPQTKVHSVTKAPATIDAMLPELEQETGIRFASMPLLFSDPYKVLSPRISSAFVAGTDKVGGTPCVHLAFISPGVNWEVWIESGARALPLRLAVTYTDRTNYPRTMVEFSHWNLHPWLSDRSFIFHPPAGSKETPFGTILKSNVR